MSTLRHLAIAFSAAAMLAASSAHGAELLLNGGFEAPAIGAGNYSYPGLPYGNVSLTSAYQDHWTYEGSALVGGGASNPWYYNTPPTGGDGSQQFVALQGTSTLAQTFTMSGSILDVSWLSAGRPGNGNNDGDQSYKVTLGALTSPDYFSFSGQNFVNKSAHFAGLTNGAQYTLTFVGVDANPAGAGIRDQTAFIDRISAVGSVPEASTWALMLVGFGGLGAMLRHRRAVFAAA